MAFRVAKRDRRRREEQQAHQQHEHDRQERFKLPIDANRIHPENPPPAAIVAPAAT